MLVASGGHIALANKAEQEDVEVEPMSTVMVNIKAKGEFSFKDNPGCFVRL